MRMRRCPLSSPCNTVKHDTIFLTIRLFSFAPHFPIDFSPQWYRYLILPHRRLQRLPMVQQVTRHDSLYLTLVSNFPMRRSDCLDRLVPAMASSFLSGQCCLQLFQFLLCLAVVTRIFEKIPITDPAK